MTPTLPPGGLAGGGAGETRGGVGQAGGIAPGAKIRVYIAPNGGNGFRDVFAQAIDENLVDVLSVSWGSPEIYNGQSDIDAFHAVFAQFISDGSENGMRVFFFQLEEYADRPQVSTKLKMVFRTNLTVYNALADPPWRTGG